jgi:hypothetical protein
MLPRSSVRVLGSAVALALAVLSSAPGALAQDEKALGRGLFDEGMSLFGRGKYVEACPKFEASLRHYPGVGTRGKLAECYEKLGRYASAWALYREVAKLSRQTGDATRERVATERARALESKLSHVTVVVPPPTEVPGLVVKRNGVEMNPATYDAPIPVDPGTIAFEAIAPNRKPFLGSVTVTEGQSARFAVPVLELAEAAAPEPLAPPPDAPFTEPPSAEGSANAWQRPVALTLAGVGVASIVVGGAFGLSAKSSYNHPFDAGHCSRATLECDASGQRAVEDARAKATVSTVLVAGGAVLAAAGIVLYVAAPRSSTALRITPATYARGGGVVVSGSLF